VLAHEEGRRIAKALGNKKAVILQNHGILTAAKTVDAAVFLFGAMDRCIESQLLADAAAAGRGTPTIKVDHETALYTRRVYTDEMEYCMFQSQFEDVIRASNGELPMHVEGEIPRLMGDNSRRPFTTRACKLDLTISPAHSSKVHHPLQIPIPSRSRPALR
jgi:hypothetical protein